MILHPDHALDLAAIRHRELIARADGFRAAAQFRIRAGARVPEPDCRVPGGGDRHPACRPDPRSAATGPATRRWPRLGRLGHRKPRPVS